MLSAPALAEPPGPASERAALLAAIRDNAVGYAELHATLKLCSPARDLRDRYLDTIEAMLPFALGMAAQAYDIAYLSAPRGVSNCGLAGQQAVTEGTQARLDELVMLAATQSVPAAPAPGALPDWALNGVLFHTFLFADRHAALVACGGAERGLRHGYLGRIGERLPEALAAATVRYDATLARGAALRHDCTAELTVAGEQHLQRILGDLERLVDAVARRRAAPPTWTGRLAQGFAACADRPGRPDANCYCQGEAAANRSQAMPAALDSELAPLAERRCAEPQALRLSQYERCIEVYGAFVDGERLARAERYCGCVADYAVRNWRQRPLAALRMDGIEACQSAAARDGR
jgi:hypothetical protein